MMLPKKHRWIWLSGALALVLTIVLISVALRNNKIEYVNPKYGPIVEAIYGLGKVKTNHIFEVKLGVIKTVRKMFVKEGDFVKKNDRLVQFEDGVVFSAPFSGAVTYVAFHEKQYAFPQQPVVRIEDLGSKFVEVSLEQQGALRVKAGLPVRVVFESIRGEVLKGKVAAIFSRNDEFLAHINVPLADNVLPGMTADVAIEVDRKEKVLLVPLSAISDGRIKLKRNGKRKTIQLKIGSVDGSWAEVMEGDVSLNDEILVPGRIEKKN